MLLRGVLAVLAAAFAADPAAAQVERVEREALRVCADPDAMPFSDRAGHGFENRLAALMAADLGLPLETTWYPQTVGFVRNTLGARRCDLVLGTVAGEPLMQNTNSYYRSAYALVVRADAGLDVAGALAGKLRHRRVAVVERTPGAALATALGVADIVAHGLLPGGPGRPAVAAAVDEVRSGAVDAALLWAPAAGLEAAQGGPAVLVLPLPDGMAGQRLVFAITMGLRTNEPDWKAWLNRWIGANRDRIAAVLAAYAVPTVE